MSIGGLSGASLAASALPVGPGLGAASDKPLSAAEKIQAQADARAADQKATLEQIRQKGIYAWAQQEKLEALKKKIRQQVLADRKIDEAALAGMKPEDRASAEKSIEEEIARRIKEAMKTTLEAEAKTAAQQGKPVKPMIIDISV
jgi:hypothetical protein